MKQLVQNLKDGKMELMEVPFPPVKPGCLLVRNHFSVISAGTEGKTVMDARAGYIGKAKSRKKEVKQVIESVKVLGLSKTYDMVMDKLSAPSPLGYSCSGEVIAVGNDVKGFAKGDFVACGGASASHSEIISVPVNLCAKIPREVDLKYAAFTTVGAIAMQGIRQADLRLGENCVVIGLGLIGQLTMQILNAGGIFPIGIDIDADQVDLSNKTGIGKSFNRDNENIEQNIFELTRGFGTDAVIITAGTSSLDPVELAGKLCRKKGRVIIVGAVPTGFSREHYYKKELELKMSSSYGPGRYDTNYEEKGFDYPIGYVRWTENRNMQAFVDLLNHKKINPEPLVTHVFNFEEAPKAYDVILNKTESYTGIVLKYDVEQVIKNEKLEIKKASHTIIHSSTHTIPKIGFIGAGNFAQNFLLPALKGKANLIGVATSRSTTSKHAADKFGFNYATCEADEIINDKNVNTVFIATRHNLHAEFVIKALEAGKNVFVEKPLAMNEEQLAKIYEAYHASTHPFNLLVGYNRRFAPHITKLKELLSNDLPVAINYRINAGAIPGDHWIHDPEIGGGRIIGEACHFIDLCMFIAGSLIISVHAESLDARPDLMDSVVISLKFKNGSVASVSYFSNGNKKLSKEYLEVFQGGKSFIIKDFRELKILSRKDQKMKLSRQDKGHADEIKSFINSIKNSLPSPIPFEELYTTSLAAFKVIESIQKSEVVKL